MMLSFFINLLINPPFWFLIGLIWLWKKKWHKGWVAFYLLCFYACTTAFLPHRLAAYLEDQYPPLSLADLDTSQTYHIIVLGAGFGRDKRLSAINLLDYTVLARLCEGVRAMNKLPHSQMITSGPPPADGIFSQAEAVRLAAIELGIDSNRIFIQSKPRSTSQEVQAYFERFGNKTTVIVSTSAIHLPRAVMLFEKKGIKTIPAPSNYIVKRENSVFWHHFLPSLSFFPKIQKCLHEVVGYWKDLYSHPSSNQQNSKLL